MWNNIEVANNELLAITCEGLTVYILRTEDEWRFSHRYEESGAAGCADGFTFTRLETPPPDVEWIRIVSTGNETLRPAPALPDRPLVIRPASPISILPGRYADFYVAVPAWLQFHSSAENPGTYIAEFPFRKLSNTWFGDPAGGELCYSLDTQLLRSQKDLQSGSARIICPVTVRNGSKEKLNFERICVHVENLGIFEHNGIMWTNEIKVLFSGVDQISQTTIRNKPPDAVDGAVKLADPRIRPNKNILRRSFSFFRQVTGI